MRHKRRRFRLNRFTSWRRQTIRDIAKAVLIHQSIKTTKTRAQASRKLIENLITLGKKNTLEARRAAFQELQDHLLVKKLFCDISPLFSNRIGGYTRIINIGCRRGDNTQMVILELTEKKEKILKKKEKEEETKKLIPKEEVLKEEKPKILKEKPPRKFLGGLRGFFRKERDQL